MLESPERGIGGGIGQAQEGDGYVTVYAEVDDPQAYLDKAEQLGGQTVVPVTEMEMVTFALFTDPEGHLFGIVKARDGGSLSRAATVVLNPAVAVTVLNPATEETIAELDPAGV